MIERLQFQEIFRVDGYGLLVNFSDGTHAKYTVDELANMRPVREQIQKVEELGALKPSTSRA